MSPKAETCISYPKLFNSRRFVTSTRLIFYKGMRNTTTRKWRKGRIEETYETAARKSKTRKYARIQVSKAHGSPLVPLKISMTPNQMRSSREENDGDRDGMSYNAGLKVEGTMVYRTGREKKMGRWETGMKLRPRILSSGL